MKRRFLKTLEKGMEVVSEAASAVQSLRDSPKALDYLAVGTRVVGLAGKVVAELAQRPDLDHWHYFNENRADPWVTLPPAMRAPVLALVSSGTPHEPAADAGPQAYVGAIDGEEVGWLSLDKIPIAGPFVRVKRRDVVLAKIGPLLWERMATRHLVLTEDGLADAPALEAVTPSATMRGLRDRVRAFLGGGIGRSVLLVGAPGTGKSVCLRYLVSEIGLRSLHVDLKIIDSDRNQSPRVHDDYSEVLTLEVTAQLLSPDVLIVDDIDRIGYQAGLLRFLEDQGSRTKLVLASANDGDAILEPLRRPGRFDEVVTFAGLDPDVVAAIAGQEHVERLAGLPVAYVVEFAKRARVLGADVAVAELGDLAARAGRAG